MAERERRVISLVGGGGKTTTMYALAEIFREEGKKVIVTTSTHLQAPPEEIRAWDIEEVRSLWKSDQIAVIGTDCESNKNLAAGDQAAVNQMENKKSVKKMRMPDGSFLQEVLQEAEVVLIEADGAKHLPCKVPIEKEPVIIQECTDVIAVVGMDALGKPLEEVCFRKDLAVQLFQRSTEICHGLGELPVQLGDTVQGTAVFDQLHSKRLRVVFPYYIPFPGRCQFALVLFPKKW